MTASVLVVDDNPQVRKLMRVTLEGAGCEVRQAADGAAALASLDPAPDLIVQDMLLPDMDGLSLLRQVRTNPATARTPVIAVSGFAPRLFGEEAGAAGFAAQLQKPVAPSALLRAAGPYLGGIDTTGVRRRTSPHCAREAELRAQVEERDTQLAMLSGMTEALLRLGCPEDAMGELLARALEATGLEGAELRWETAAGGRTWPIVVGRPPRTPVAPERLPLSCGRPVVSGDAVVIALHHDAVQLGLLVMGTEGRAPDAATVQLCGTVARQLAHAIALGKAQAELRASRAAVVQRLAAAMSLRDGETGEHTRRMGRLCADIGRQMGMTSDDCRLLQEASTLHDVGKLATPDAILHKPGPLTPEERATIEEHARAGRDMLAGSGTPLLDLAAEIAWAHHEWWDGSGYPRGLQGEEIPLAARIAAVADVFDAMTSDRPYRAALPVQTAVAELLEGRNRHFDPAVVDAFLALLQAAA